MESSGHRRSVPGPGSEHRLSARGHGLVPPGYLNMGCRLFVPNLARSYAGCLILRGDRSVVIAGTGNLPIPSRPDRIASQILEPAAQIGARVAPEDGERLEPQELRPGRADPSRRRTEAASAEHGGDGG